MAPPFRQAEFDIMNDDGISVTGGVLDLAVEHGFISKAGAFFKIGDETIGQGREAAKTYLKTNPKTVEKLKKDIWKAVLA